MGRTHRHRGRKSNKMKRENFDDFVHLLKWLRIKCRNTLSPSMFNDTGRGMMTKSQISPGEIIISIPKHFLITMETVLHSEVGQMVNSSIMKLSLQQLMSVFLILESRKGHNSPWWNYLAVVPKTYDTPAFWDSKDLILFSPKLYSRVLSSLQDLQTSYEEVVSFFSDKLEFSISYKDYRWAWYSINTRSVYYVNKSSPYLVDKNKDIALAPLLDLLNHSTWAKVDAGFNEQSKCYEIRTHNTYKKHDQVFISYGAHNNIHLLMEYGFILPNNPHDVYEIDFGDVLKIAEHLKVENIEKKKNIIEEYDLNKKLVCSLDGISWSFSTLLKIIAMDFDELKSWKVVFDGHEISAKNKQCVQHIGHHLLQRELGIIRSAYDKFPSKDTSKLTYHQRMAWDLLKTDENILLQSIKLFCGQLWNKGNGTTGLWLATVNLSHQKLVCSLDGMSWSFSTLLKIIAMDFNELKSWKVVFDGHEISAKNKQCVQHIGHHLLQRELGIIRSAYDKFPSKDTSKLTYHQRMAWDLLKTDENILLQSIKLL